VIHAEAFNIAIPKACAIIGLNDEPIVKALNLTTIRIPLKAMGEKLLDHVLSSEREHTSFDVTLIERQTI
jgi:DNA-binding LacI/PurR family transcriptional regulator